VPDIDLYGDLAGILTMAVNRNRPLKESDPSVVQVKMVAGARNQRYLSPSPSVLLSPYAQS
jgi:hypothetical protein